MVQKKEIYKKQFITLLKSIGFAFLCILIFTILTGYILIDFMNGFAGTLWYPIISSLASLIFLIALFQRAKTININSVKYLLNVAFCLFIFNCLQLFHWEIAEVYPPFQRPLGYPMLNFGDLMIVIIALSLFYHFASIDMEYVRVRVMILLGLLTSPTIVLSLILIIYPNDNINKAIYQVLPLLALAVLGIVMYGVKVMVRIYFNSSDDTSRNGSLLMIISLFYMSIAFSTQIITDDLVDFIFFKAEIFQLLMLAIATGMLGYAYIKNPHFLFAIPFQVYELIIYDMEGTVIWSHNFDGKQSVNLEERSKGLNTIAMVLREISGLNGYIKQIKLSDGDLIIRNHTFFSIALISELVSPQLSRAVTNFTNEFASIYVHGTRPEELELIHITRKYFPYLFTS